MGRLLFSTLHNLRLILLTFLNQVIKVALDVLITIREVRLRLKYVSAFLFKFTILMTEDWSLLLGVHIKHVQAILQVMNHNERGFVKVKVGVGPHEVNNIICPASLHFLVSRTLKLFVLRSYADILQADLL